jgi:hypothetical protein
MADQYIVVDTIAGRTEAEILCGFLEARGIKCMISQEAAGWVYGLNVGPLASVDILVPSHQADEAREALREIRESGGGEDTTADEGG